MHRWFYAAVGAVALAVVAAAIAVVWLAVFPAILAGRVLQALEDDEPGSDRRARPPGRVDQAHSWRASR